MLMDVSVDSILEIAGVSILVLALMVLLWYILQVIALWKVFKKAGYEGWKSIIPLYNEFCLFHISWKNREMPWIWLGLILGGGWFQTYCAQRNITSGFMYEAGVYLILAAIVLQIIRNFKEAKAFGKKGGFGLGLSIGPICTVISNVTGVNLSWLFWYLTPIFNMVLGLGHSKYLGPQD